MGELLTRRRGLILPSGGGGVEYQKVEYIESHGAEYINTGYVPTSISEITSITAFTIYTNSQYIGVLQQVSPSYARWHFDTNSNFIEVWRQGTGADVTISYDNKFHEFYLSDSLVKIDDIHSHTPYRTFQTTLPFCLFARMRESGTANFANARQKDFIAKEGGVEVMHLVPCYRKSDGVIGMLDEVSGTFFTNEGGGAFTKGADV